DLLSAAVAEALHNAKIVERLPKLEISLATLHGSLDRWCRNRQAGATTDGGMWNFDSNPWATVAESYRVTTFTTGCTASAIALGHCADSLDLGHAEIGIVAGAEGL